MDIVDSWVEAEKTCFDALLSHFGAKENAEGFRGYVPRAAVDIWVFSSGTNADQQMARFWGNEHNESVSFGTFRVQAYAACAYSSRDDAMRWAMNVLKCIRDTKNMHCKNNVAHLRILEGPAEPTPEILESGITLWTTRIPMELMFTTQTTS